MRAIAREAGPHHVLIIRHAEKTGDKSDVHLSRQGVERAAALFRLFEPGKDRPDPFPRPDFIFAATNSAISQRPLETVRPLALKLKLPIDQSFDSKLLPVQTKVPGAAMDGIAALRAEVFNKPRYVGKTILVSWRHSSIPELARALGARDAPAKWADECFDRIWQISYISPGGVTFVNRPQRLLPGDSVK